VDEENDRSYLFLNPQRILRADESLFAEIEQALAEGVWVAGFFSYEYGELLQGRKPRGLAPPAPPLAWLGVYSHPFVFNHRTGCFEGSTPKIPETGQSYSEQRYELCNLNLSLSQSEYADKIAAIHEYIRSGDTYQVNFTGKFQFDFTGSSPALFTALIENQPVPYSAFLHAEGWEILSLSPELFFRRNGSHILTRPMKGTAPRGADWAEDQSIAKWLRNNPKNRSENVMIVDLLRNDLGRICEFGSIHVNHLFSVEKYETLFQMTSEISGRLRPGVPYSEIFQSLFPCGSITGAPKLRTMDIIRELEPEPRGVYTGAIGFFSPNAEAVFSVPIRTLALQNGRGTMGVGSGIVIDSQAEDEYRECLLKARFLTEHTAPEHSPDHSEEPFQLLESILWHDGYCRLSMHLERMEQSARYFDFRFDREAILTALEAAAMHFKQGHRIKARLTVDRYSEIQITDGPAAENTPGKVMLSSIRVSSSDRFLRHKTTRRSLYDQQYRWALEHGFVEVLFLNERDEITEGAISNLFIEKDGQWLTPPIRSGALPGIYRRHLLDTNPRAKEIPLHLSDLLSADVVYLCNSVRGLTEVRVVRSDSDGNNRENL
jgi:para-aminobenzoate synthetase/4-amino-4-deoxychorismate lyase